MIDTSFLVGNAPAPLLNPLDVQAKRIAIQNALAQGQLQQQQIAGGALGLQEQQQAMAEHAAYKARFASPANALAASPASVAPPPSVIQDPATGQPMGSAPAYNGPPAANALAGAPPTAAHEISDDDLQGIFGEKAFPLIKARNETRKIMADAQETQGKVEVHNRNYWGALASGLQGVNYDPRAVQGAISQAQADGMSNTPQFQQFVQTAQSNPASLPQLGQIAIAQSEEQQKALSERTTAGAHMLTAQTTAAKDQVELDQKKFVNGAGLLGSTRDKNSYAAAYSALDPSVHKQMTPPSQWTPQTAAAMQQKGLSAQEQVTTAQAAKRDAQTAANENARLSIERGNLALAQSKQSFDTGAIQRAAHALATGDLTRLSDIASLRGDQRLQLFDLAKQENPNFNTAELDRRIKNEEYYANGKGATNLQSFNTFLEHGGAASSAVDQIRLAGIPAINKPLNWWRSNMSGSPELKQLEASIEPVRKEFEGFLLGGRALEGDDRKQAEVILNENSSPAQIQQALKTMGHTALARMNEENYRYKKVSKHDLVDPFSPEAMQGAKSIGLDLPVQSSAAPAAAHGVPDLGSTFNGGKVLKVTRIP